MQKVEVYVSIGGYYCKFYEMSFYVAYDITNNIKLGEYTLKELEEWTDDSAEYSDIEKREAILLDGKYYVEW
jgi:hypothetical protein